MEFLCRITQDSGMDFGERNRAIFKRYLSENPGRLLKITPVLPESGKQRRFLEGAVIPLVTYYQEGMSHTSHEDCDKVREWLKLEFNGDFIEMHGKVHRIGKSTKGRDALQPFLERVVDWLIENYQPPAEALDPANFKHWHDTIRPYGEANYIDYLRSIGLL